MDRSQRRELKQIIEMLEDCHGKLQGMSAEEETKYCPLPCRIARMAKLSKTTPKNYGTLGPTWKW